MPCIMISRLSYSSGKAIAHKAASHLGYECIDQEVFQKAAAESGVSEAKLARAFQEPPSFFGMSPAVRRCSIAHVSAALARRLLGDNVVYHGSFGHLLIPGISHVLKVRIFAPRQDRIATKIKRETGISAGEAERVILRRDKQRIKLARLVFKVDDDDPTPFDLMINTSQMDEDTAVGVISGAVKLKRYQPMTYSLRSMENLELSVRVRAFLTDLDPDVKVQAENGNLRLRSRVGKKRLAEMRQRVSNLEGVKGVEVDAVEDIFGQLAGGAR